MFQVAGQQNGRMLFYFQALEELKRNMQEEKSRAEAKYAQTPSTEVTSVTAAGLTLNRTKDGATSPPPATECPQDVWVKDQGVEPLS